MSEKDFEKKYGAKLDPKGGKAGASTEKLEKDLGKSGINALNKSGVGSVNNKTVSIKESIHDSYNDF